MFFTLCNAVLMMLVLKGLSYIIFPQFSQEIISRYIIDAKPAQLKKLGLFLLVLAFCAWKFIISEI